MSPLSADWTAVLWRKRLNSAARITVACAIVGCSTLYGPAKFRAQVTYAAFAYVTAILIVSEATLGHALKGSWHALIGSTLVMGPAVAILWVIGPGKFNGPIAALAVGIGAFGVALTESAPLLAKRIAFGQMVIVCVGAVVLGEKADVVLHPFHVAASTGTGALASVVAMVVPIPRLANCVVRKKCRSYIENASERINLFVKAMVADDSYEAAELLAQIKTLAEKASKRLRGIQHNQGALMWERPHLRLLSTPGFKYPADVLGQVEMTLKALEMALASYLSEDPKASFEQQLPKDELQGLASQVSSRIQQLRTALPFAELTKLEPENTEDDTNQKDTNNNSPTLERTITPENLSVFFYFLCMKCLNNTPQLLKSIKSKSSSDKFNQKDNTRWNIFTSSLPRLNNQNLIFASKCSLSLGLAVLLGLTYTKNNGYWSGLTIAISFVPSRQATFSATNARAQGTALGSIYGVLGYFLFHRFGTLKLLSLIPWIIFTTFLRHSKMYGEAGSISAVIAALLIMGRRNYGTPTDFAVARLTEAFIGLSCFIVVELLLQPKRAAVLARAQVAETVGTIQLLLEEMTLQVTHQNKTDSTSSSSSLEERKNTVTVQVNNLKRSIEEATQEPNFWFRPFQADCYTLLLESVTKMADLLVFMGYSIEMLCSEMQQPGAEWKGYREQFGVDIMLYKKLISSTIKHVEEAMAASSNKKTEKHVDTESDESSSQSNDIEMGKHVRNYKTGIRVPDIDRDEAELILGSFLQHIGDLTQSSEVVDDPELNKQLLISLGSLAFCLRSLVLEATEVGKIVNELIRRENY